MSHLQVAVLRGGPSEEYQISMRTGASVLRALTEKGYQAKDIVINKQGQWLERGLVRQPEMALSATDVVFIALHGTYGEDGQVQKILQRLKIPFTGSSSFSSALAFNKVLTKKTLAAHGVLTPRYQELNAEEIVNLDDVANLITNSFGPEYIIKPAASGSSFGVELVRTPERLTDSLEKALKLYDKVLVEEFIRGKEATCATLENYRNESIYIFPTVEIVTPRDAQYFDTDSKYNGQTMEICPARFSYGERVKIAEISELVHNSLNLSQYSRSDFIVSDRGVYFLEVNTLPGLTEESLYPKAAAAVGLDINNLVSHLVETATC
jgi:D-alanine-D-alanine ligase